MKLLLSLLILLAMTATAQAQGPNDPGTGWMLYHATGIQRGLGMSVGGTPDPWTEVETECQESSEWKAGIKTTLLEANGYEVIHVVYLDIVRTHDTPTNRQCRQAFMLIGYYPIIPPKD